MCLVIGAETILANILADKDTDEGIGIYDINKYCFHLNKILDKKRVPYRYFDISLDSLDRAILANKKDFIAFGCNYFRRTVIHVEHYNASFELQVREALVLARDFR